MWKWQEGNEGCDNGNLTVGYGWSSSWTVESGWTWNRYLLSVSQN